VPNTEANFDLERLLIKKGIDMNAKDERGRTPLTYAFVKIGKHSEYSEIDPIETVSSYCGYKDIKVDEPDFWGKTPLHYAA
jgi:ankyrin repeat protein